MLPRNNKTQQERRTEEINQKEPKSNIFKVEQPTPQKPIENKMIKNEKDNMDKPRKYIPLKRCSSAVISYTYEKKLQEIITCEPEKCV